MRLPRGWLTASLLAAAAPAAAEEPAQQARGEAFLRLPYWPGYWVGANQTDTPISGIALRNADQGPPPSDSLAVWGNNAPWNEEGRRRIAEITRAQAARKGLGWGYPLMMNSATPIQVLITPEEVLIINAYNETRHIYTDGRPMPPVEDLWPTVTGTSIGHWEGDTLVVETVMVTNPNAFFQGAPPLSEQARYRERIRLDGDTLRVDMTIEDPVTLAGPWNARLSLVRDEGFDRMIQVDWNNDRTGTDGEFNTIEPADEREAQGGSLPRLPPWRWRRRVPLRQRPLRASLRPKPRTTSPQSPA